MAVLLGALLVLTGIAAPAEAATSRSLRISISPTAVQAGGVVSVSGRITNSPTGATVKIQRKVGSSWVNVTSARTTSSWGGYRVKVRMPTKPAYYKFRAIAGASRTLKGAVSSPVTVTVVRSVIVKFESNKDTITPGETVTLTGKVYPFKTGTVATIERFNGVSWTTLVTTTIKSTGTFKRYLKPPASTTYRVVVPRTGLYGTGVSKSVKVLIPDGPVDPEILTTSLPDAFTDAGYNEQLTKDGEPGTWAVTSGALPPGLSLNANTGTISGTPSTAGTFGFTVTFSETETLLSDTQELAIRVLVKPRITTTSLPDATGYVSYGPVTLQKAAQAGAWSITSGTLPAGMNFDTETGVLSGKPTVKDAGDYPLTFRYTESAEPNQSVTRALNLHLNAAPAPVITTTALPEAAAYANYATTLARTGNAGTWSITSGTLPSGITFNETSGALAGKPTVAGDYPLTFRFTETESGTFGSKALTLKVNPAPAPVITTTSLPTATAYSTYSASVVRTGNAGTWSITSGTLPSGLSFNTSSGAITGKPTVAGSYPLTFKFTETESGTFASKSLTLTVDPAPDPVISTSSLPLALEGSAYTTDLEVSTAPPGAWSLDSGSLPPNLELSPSGTISGTATTAGLYSFTVRFTETESGTSATRALQIRVYSRPVVTTPGMPDALRDNVYSQFLSSSGGSTTKSWSLAGGSLPPGLTLSSTGKISGSAGVDGDYTFTVRINDNLTGATATKALTIHVGTVAIFTVALPDGKLATGYDAEMDGRPHNLVPSGWTVASGALPPGLDMTFGGRFYGTPTLVGTYTFSIKYQTIKGSRTRQYTIQVNP